MKSNLISKFLVLLIITSVLSIFIIETQAYTAKTYNKSEDDQYLSPIGGGFFVLGDGSKLLRFYRPIDDMCNEPDLRLRILHLNGTLSPFIIKNFEIPRLNFCRLNNTVTYPDYIQITKLKGENPNSFYIYYYKISDTDPTLPFGRYIAQVNIEGEIIGYELFCSSFYSMSS